MPLRVLQEFCRVLTSFGYADAGHTFIKFIFVRFYESWRTRTRSFIARVQLLRAVISLTLWLLALQRCAMGFHP